MERPKPSPIHYSHESVAPHVSQLQTEGRLPGNRGDGQPFQPNPKEQQARERLSKPPPEEIRALGEPRHFQAPTGETPVMPQPQATSGEFVSHPQQEASTGVFSAQSSGQEHQRQTQDGNPVVRRRGGSKEKPLEYTPTGELYVGSLLRKLRQEKGIDLKDAAEQMGIRRGKLSLIERNHGLPSENDLKKYAEMLDVSVDEFYKAYQHPRTIRRTPPEQSKRFLPIHLQGKPLTECDIELYYKPYVRWQTRFRQPPGK
jgi:transcriptional regulator with XRE-family HTH domain